MINILKGMTSHDHYPSVTVCNTLDPLALEALYGRPLQ